VAYRWRRPAWVIQADGTVRGSGQDVGRGRRRISEGVNRTWCFEVSFRRRVSGLGCEEGDAFRGRGG
jgi:hypothetical protein